MARRQRGTRQTRRAAYLFLILVLLVRYRPVPCHLEAAAAGALRPVPPDIRLRSWFAPGAPTRSRSSAPRPGWRWPGRATGGSAPGRASRPRPCAAGCAGSAPGPRRYVRTRCASSASSADPPVRRCQGRPGRRWVTRSTPSPPARMLPSPGYEVGPPSDIFSLGAVLAFAARGEGPFGTRTTAALLYPVVHRSPNHDGSRPKRGR